MTALLLLLLAGGWAGVYGAARHIARRRRGHWPFVAEAIAAGGALALATAGFFWQILFTANTWMPAGGGDLAPFLFPNYRFAAESLRQGHLPLWNPHLYSGAPFAADIQSGLFYPVNLLVFGLVPDFTYTWLELLAVFHFWLAGVIMYLCLRLLAPAQADQPPLSPGAALAGALAFEFSDLFIVHFGNLNMIAVAAWLPLVFLLFQRSLHRRSWGLAAAAGAVLAVATLAGHIQITLFILLTLGLYALWHCGGTIYDARPREPRQLLTANVMFSLLALALAVVITVGLAALLLLPAYEMSRYTPRAELPYPEAAAYSLHPAQLVGLLAPNYFGRDPALHWGPWQRVETGYIGVATLLLAVIGALVYPGRLKGFWVTLGLLALALALGGYSVLHGWLYAAAPGFDQLRAPARFILLMDFALAALAAGGVNQLINQPLDAVTARRLPAALRLFTWGLGGLLAVALPLSYYAMLVTQDRNPAIFNRAVGAASAVATLALFALAALAVLHLINRRRLHSTGAALALVAVIGLDLFTLGANVDVGHTDPTAGFNHPAALAFLKNDANRFRTEVTTDVWAAWQPNTALLHGLDDAWGLYNPLTLADTTLYWSGAPPRSTGRYNFLGIKYIIAGKGGAPADGNITPIFDADPQINVYLNQSALARVLFVGRSQVVGSHAAAWEAIRAADFDPARTVVLEGGQALNSQPVSSLAIVGYAPETVTVAVTTDQPGYLVLADAYYPGWQATVDGQPAPIERANYAFRAVAVPAGSHTVQFRFDPPVWKVGLTVSAVTLLALLGWAGRALWLRRRSG